MKSPRSASAGFTLIEVVVVCAVLGALALLAYPNMIRFSEQQQTKASATKIAGLLGTARSLAISEAIPRLVFINPKTVDANGSCDAAAVLVRDSDRSYTISEGDRVREVALDPGACRVTEPFGESGSTAESSVPLPSDDLAVRVLAMTAETLAEEEEDDSEESGSSDSGKVVDVVVNGATFPIDADSGRPVVAFSERGIPVDPASPERWGSGAGGVYLTNGHSSVYAVVVQPLGEVHVRTYDRVSGAWR